MTDRDKTNIVHVPGQTDAAGNRSAANMDGVSTQVLMDTSGLQVGHLLVVDGAGKGQQRPVYSGTNQVGRSPDNRIALDFGDTTISRLQHAVIVYEQSNKTFRIYDGGKQNPILINGNKLVGEQPIAEGDLIKIGLTTLKFTRT